MKLGILGGTFDPIHMGHLRSAEEIGHQLHLEKVCLIPSASPPHKTSEPVTPFRHRLAMARLAVSEAPLLEVMDLEGRRPGFSYSIETLMEIHGIFRPDPEIFFILGTDAFLEIQTWKEYRRLFDYAHFVIMRRAGSRPEKIASLLSKLDLKIKSAMGPDVFIAPSGKALIIMAPTPINISSTRIREMVMERESIRFLVPDSVREYIMKKGLYKDHANPRKGKALPPDYQGTEGD